MLPIRLIGIILFFTSFLLATPKEIAISAGEWNPYINKGEQSGALLEITQRVFEKAGIQPHFEFHPWVKAYNQVKYGSVQASLAWFKTSERMLEVHYADMPLCIAEQPFFYDKNVHPEGIKWTKLEHLKKYKIVVINGLNYIPVLEEAGLDLVYVQTEAEAWLKLISGEVDLFPEDRLVGKKHLLNNLDERSLSLVATEQNLIEDGLYVVFSKKNKDSEYLLEIFNKTYRELRYSGEFDKILDHYGVKQKSDNIFRVITEEYPPFNYTEGYEIKGLSTDVIRELFKRVQHPNFIEVMPWARGYKTAQIKKNIILYSTTRIPSREKMFKWVGPIAVNKWVFFAKKGSGLKINSLDEARKVKAIGAYKDDAAELILLEKGFKNVDSVTNDYLNVRKLMLGRIDLWIVGEVQGYYKASTLGFVKDIEVVGEIQKNELYLAFSKETDDAIINRWQKALDEIKKDGTYSEILSRYGMERPE